MEHEIQHDASSTSVGPQNIYQSDGIHPAQFPGEEFSPLLFIKFGPNLSDAITLPPTDIQVGETPSVRLRQRTLLTEPNHENPRNSNVHDIFILHSCPLFEEDQTKPLVNITSGFH